MRGFIGHLEEANIIPHTHYTYIYTHYDFYFMYNNDRVCAPFFFVLFAKLKIAFNQFNSLDYIRQCEHKRQNAFKTRRCDRFIYRSGIYLQRRLAEDRVKHFFSTIFDTYPENNTPKELVFLNTHLDKDQSILIFINI